MTNDGSFGAGVASTMFDLNSQKGVTSLLSSVRASTIAPAQKNELRDLIFQYTNGGKDPSVLISLEHKISSYQITPVAKNVTSKTPVVVEPVPVYQFGTSRPAPTFSPTQPVPSASIPVVTQQPTPVPTVVYVPVAPQPTPTVTVESIPVPVPVQPPAPAQVVTAPAQVALAQATPVILDTDASAGLERIKEIKSLVNERIGNPVNLVDIDNEVGREYMSSMLDAMKKLNTGSSAVSAMKRLEDAFAMVEKALDEHQKQPTQPVVETPATTESAMPVQVDSPSVPVVTNTVVEPEIPVSESSATVPEIPVSAPLVPEPVSVSPVQVGNVATPVSETQFKPTEPAWGPATDTIVRDGRAHSLAETKEKLRTPDELPLSSAIETSSVSGDPLYTKEIDEGLDQLLLEWSLFKKSGLFGAGPKGRQHPLFIKIATLQIPLLLAGRFEGATQDIKQSITDYMNGWRYEQGIIYEHGENFEHYLRRVIRHIIDLQKRKRPA